MIRWVIVKNGGWELGRFQRAVTSLVFFSLFCLIFQASIFVPVSQAASAEETPTAVESTVDLRHLQGKVDDINAENLVQEKYTPESWSKLVNALDAAKAVLTKPNVTQAEIDGALSVLVTAREGLKKQEGTVDKSKLQTKVEEIAVEKLQEKDYTRASWKELQNRLGQAYFVLDDPQASQIIVDVALEKLIKARQDLKRQDDAVYKRELRAKVEEIEDKDLDKDDYTRSSWRDLEDALDHARDVIDDTHATQSEVDDALYDLKKAWRDLEDDKYRDRDRDRDKKGSYTTPTNSFFTGGRSTDKKEERPATNKKSKRERGYINGYPDGTFQPDRTVTRAEMAAILLNAGMVSQSSANKGRFFDVADNYWAVNPIHQASTAGMMSGYPDGTFRPSANITRAEIAAVIYKYKALQGAGGGTAFFDVRGDHWSSPIIAAVVAKGYMAGYPNGTFQPEKALTRAEAVTILNRVLNRVPENQAGPQRWPDVVPGHWAYKDIEEASIQ
ncbi:S-layer homology domain-containing protein [Brevibacillus antibioticus]|uniref:S-layer homology domain-containing protein n=1 Tax=Brevibacillus antibioticus TaxID=2570228 RepID=A0A4V5TIV8_9BACL|nr:S-layer homology domain-containing protein [Brevibacillus antibioticus]TKI56763.1 S-layer homology domain-containing protein [Brevibacillus antibioticus]